MLTAIKASSLLRRLIYLPLICLSQIGIAQADSHLSAICSSDSKTGSEAHYQLIAQYPHDPEAFTEGLVFHQGQLFESTGLLGASTIRKVDIESGQVINSLALPNRFFAEGLTALNNELIQLTWKMGRVFIYRPDTLQVVRTFDYPGEAWGLTSIDGSLVISNGSSELHFIDPESLRLIKTLKVNSKGQPIGGLNELEFVEGAIYAIVWPSPCIVKIDPADGEVLAWLNMSSLSPIVDPDWRTVLNGIAYDPVKRHFFVTGKHWPYLYAIKLSDING
ncbi:glutaminyl-peptide cyclotransferase [Methylomarinum sp. Ch1-1]|uniref:Glutaminyl-peptide cyclotransferase n=1 Tax=Methylomarinum roseum TaxID=3067653 RepID=A0AAU7NVH8_9GAMM|nr:glutaminyl-peptide cyclotransferase [Methylomarinum sp. Ch1-1]MDP4522951.1 glutaminyl-peptide cyclotransferase [Methylomarinum sp. Ch1-1]